VKNLSTEMQGNIFCDRHLKNSGEKTVEKKQWRKNSGEKFTPLPRCSDPVVLLSSQIAQARFPEPNVAPNVEPNVVPNVTLPFLGTTSPLQLGSIDWISSRFSGTCRGSKNRTLLLSLWPIVVPISR
jgi:hypothetical protein